MSGKKVRRKRRPAKSGLAAARSVVPGGLRVLFLRNLKKREWGEPSDAVCAMRKAQAGLSLPDEGFGELEIEEDIGDGAFGTVSIATHTVLPGEFALKTLKEGVGPAAKRGAAVEMMTFARLSGKPHPNLVSAVAIDDRQVGTMPILLPMAVEDFFDVIQYEDSWCLSTKLDCVRQVASGAQHMHKHGLGHGDIKLENVLMMPSGDTLVPQLADFGMARELGEMRPKMMGTTGYMPLEVMLGSVATRENQDVFALAAMAFTVFAAPEKAKCNMFIHEDLYTPAEKARKEELKVLKATQDISVEADEFDIAMTMRTLEDGSYERMLEERNLHKDLVTKHLVSVCLIPFLQKVPNNRPDIDTFQTVIGNFAMEVAEREAEDES